MWNGYWGTLYNWLTLPAEYDTSISYLEMTARFQKALKFIAQEVQNNTAQGQQNAQAIQNLSNCIDQVYHYIDQVYNYIDQVYQSITQMHKEDVAQIYTKISALNNSLAGAVVTLGNAITAGDANSKAYTDLQIQIVLEKLKNLDLPTVFDPFTQQLSTIQETLNSFYSYMRWDCVECGEFDRMGFTAQEYDELGLRALDFDLYSRHLLWKAKEWNPRKARSPYTGSWQDVGYLVNQLFSYHQAGITAGEFDGLASGEFTCQMFDNAEYTAYQLDWTPVLLRFNEPPYVPGPDEPTPYVA